MRNVCTSWLNLLISKAESVNLGLGEMFEGDSADMCAGKFPLMLLGDRVEGLACADPGARTPIGVSEIANVSIYLVSDQYQTKFCSNLL